MIESLHLLIQIRLRFLGKAVRKIPFRVIKENEGWTVNGVVAFNLSRRCQGMFHTSQFKVDATVGSVASSKAIKRIYLT